MVESESIGDGTPAGHRNAMFRSTSSSVKEYQMRRRLFWAVSLVVTSLFSFAVQPAFADPADDLAAVKKAFSNVNSVHVDVKRPQETVSLDMVGANKVHLSMSNGTQLIEIGQQTWFDMGGRWIEQPQVRAMAETLMARLRSLSLEGSDIRKNYRVTDAGMTTANGAPAHKYHVVSKGNGHQFDIIVGANDLPVQYINSDETWTFSQYNSVADIRPPM